MEGDELFDFVTDSRIRSAAFLTSLMALPGIGSSQALKIVNRSTSVEDVHRQVSLLGHTAWEPVDSVEIPEHEFPISAYSYFEPEFPSQLKELSNPPAVIWIMGSLPVGLKNVAFVGTRHPSHNGIKITESLVSCLDSGLHCLVSGLASGVDSIAHSKSLQNGIRNVAVVASGFLEALEGKSKELAHAILENGGALVSEYTPFAASSRSNFVARDRLIAALADYCVVTECGIPSGTLHTVNESLKIGRPVLVAATQVILQNNLGNRLLLNELSESLEVGQVEWLRKAKGITESANQHLVQKISRTKDFKTALGPVIE